MSIFCIAEISTTRRSMLYAFALFCCASFPLLHGWDLQDIGEQKENTKIDPKQEEELALYREFQNSVWSENLELLEACLKERVYPNKEIDAAFKSALFNGKVAVLEKLIDAGAEISKAKKPSLLIAADYYSGINNQPNHHQTAIDMVSILLNRGAQINIQDEHGYTALMTAARKWNAPLVRLLLDKGANPSIKTYVRSKKAIDFVESLEIHFLLTYAEQKIIRRTIMRQFLLGKYDTNSPISKLPKDIIGLIFDCLEIS